MADIGLKKNIQLAIIDALLTEPLLSLLNTTSGAGVYPVERIDAMDSYAADIGTAVLVDMPEATGHISAGPMTTRANVSTNLYLVFSEQNDLVADETASLVTSAIRACLAKAGRNDAVAKVGGYSNCFIVDDTGWGELGQDKVFALEVSFMSSWPSQLMVQS